jgi:hypothetical protein
LLALAQEFRASGPIQTTDIRIKKRIIRLLIEEIIATVRPDLHPQFELNHPLEGRKAHAARHRA